MNMTILSVGVKDACEILSVSRSTIYKLIELGKLKPRKIGNKTVFLLSELEAFVSDLPEVA